MDTYRETAASDILLDNVRTQSTIRADHADDLLQVLHDQERKFAPPKRLIKTPTGKHTVTFHWIGAKLVGVDIARIDGDPLLFSDLRNSNEFPMSWLLQQGVDGLKDSPLPPAFYQRIEDAKLAYQQGRSTKTADHHADVALVYSKAVQQHAPAPNKVVAEKFGIKYNTAIKWISKCRELGFLPSTTQGKTRGYL